MVRERLEAGLTQAPGTGGPNRHTSWLATTNPDGSPHVRPVGTHWMDGVFVFTSGAGARKAKNLKRDPRCALTIAALEFDLIVEGRAIRVTDLARLGQIAERYATGGWPARRRRRRALAHRGLQRADRRSGAVGRVRADARDGLRPGHRGGLRINEMAFPGLSTRVSPGQSVTPIILVMSCYAEAEMDRAIPRAGPAHRNRLRLPVPPGPQLPGT